MTFEQAKAIIEGEHGRIYQSHEILEAAQLVLKLEQEAVEHVNTLSRVPPLNAEIVAALIQGFYSASSSSPFNSATVQLSEFLAKELRWTVFQSVGLHPTKTCETCGKHRIELAERLDDEDNRCPACKIKQELSALRGVIEWRRSAEEDGMNDTPSTGGMVVGDDGVRVSFDSAIAPPQRLTLPNPPPHRSDPRHGLMGSQYERDMIESFDRCDVTQHPQNARTFEPALEAALRDATSAPSITAPERAYRQWALRFTNLTSCGIIDDFPTDLAPQIREHGIEPSYFWVMIHGLIGGWIRDLHERNAESSSNTNDVIHTLLQFPASHFGWRQVPRFRGEVQIMVPDADLPFYRTKYRWGLYSGVDFGPRLQDYPFDDPTKFYKFLTRGGTFQLSHRDYTHQIDFAEDEERFHRRRRQRAPSNIGESMSEELTRRLKFLLECEVSEELSRFEGEPNNETTRMQVQHAAVEVLHRHRIGNFPPGGRARDSVDQLPF